MLNYTSRYVNTVSVLLTILIFSCFLLLINQDWKKRQNKETLENNYTKQVYYSVIPIEKQGKRQLLDAKVRQKEVKKAEKIYEMIKKAEQTKKEKNKSNQKQTELRKINIYQTNPWRIKIPKLEIDAPITEGTSAESLRRTVGHFEQSSKWNGNIALAGHNRGYRCNFFQEIKKLEIGDQIIYQTEKGQRKYKVIFNQVIPETNWEYIEKTKDNRITLITCEENQREYRRCIQAIET